MKIRSIIRWWWSACNQIRGGLEWAVAVDSDCCGCCSFVPPPLPPPPPPPPPVHTDACTNRSLSTLSLLLNSCCELRRSVAATTTWSTDFEWSKGYGMLSHAVVPLPPLSSLVDGSNETRCTLRFCSKFAAAAATLCAASLVLRLFLLLRKLPGREPFSLLRRDDDRCRCFERRVLGRL